MCNSRPRSYTQCALSLFAAAFLTGCHKNNSEFDAGRKAEAIQDYDTALIHYDPPRERILPTRNTSCAWCTCATAAASFHMEQGQRALQKGDLQLALSEFEKRKESTPQT